MNKLSRRQAIKGIALGAASLSLPQSILAQTSSMLTKSIPSTGEGIGAVGLGTWQSFDVGNSEASGAPLREVLTTLVDAGGSMVDSSPMYGTSERVVGDLSKELNLQSKIFYATKVWTSGRQRGVDQMNASHQKMRTNQMDLMQIHNLQDWRTHLSTLYRWKAEGKIRYIGITHYLDSAHEELEHITKKERIDFVQVNYSMAELNAERTLLQAARDQGVAVITNRPYAGGALFRKTRGVELPEWASDFECKSWGQFFLKYLIAHPAVTCVIPGTSKPHHMRDNVAAGMGKMPDENQRKEMKKLIDSI